MKYLIPLMVLFLSDFSAVALVVDELEEARELALRHGTVMVIVQTDAEVSPLDMPLQRTEELAERRRITRRGGAGQARGNHPGPDGRG